MYNTETISVNELLNRMRAMKIGEEITLIGGCIGLGIYGIRSLPGGMFDNGKCWLADYYGGGATAAFSEDRGSEDGELYERVVDWLDTYDLLTEEPIPGRYPNTDRWVSVAINKYSEPESVWEFKEVKVDPKQTNRLACINFGCGLEGRAYVVVPYNATDAESVEIAKESLSNISTKELIEHLNPNGMVFDTDFTYINVDHYYHEHYDDETTDPVGTVV